MRLPSRTAFGSDRPRDRAQAITVLRRAVELGVNHVDTAAFYFTGTRSANELVNTALAPYPDHLVIAAKVGPGRDPSGTWLPMATPGQLRGQVEENLRQLGRDHLDLVYLRMLRPGPVSDHLGALADLRDTGLLRTIGLSNITTEQLTEARTVTPVAAVQNRYSLDGAHPGSEQLLRACRDQGIAFVPYFAIAGHGREAGAPPTEHPAVLAAADTHQATPAQVRLAWTLHQGPHVLAIPGTGDPDHLTTNIAAGAVHLDPGTISALDAIRNQ